MKALDLDTLLQRLSESFGYLSCVNRIGIYRSVAFIEVKTNQLFFALECTLDGNIELVSRNTQTQKHFSDYFHHPFDKGEVLYVNGLCKNDLFCINQPLLVQGDLLLSRVGFILDKCLNAEKDIAANLTAVLTALNKEREVLDLRLRNETLLDMSNFMQGRLLTILQTMQIIHENELSLARFGDAEINCMTTEKGCPFQKHDWQLMAELREISTSNSDLLVCYPGLMVESNFWANYWPRTWARCKFFLQRDTYGDSFITRPQGFLMYRERLVEAWKTIWANKKVCFVTGEGSRMNAQHFMFDNLKDADYIYSQSAHAYADIDNVVSKCRQKQGIDVFLIAMGVAGTALASRLHKLGLRALDIGHVNNSYDTVFNNAPVPEKQ